MKPVTPPTKPKTLTTGLRSPGKAASKPQGKVPQRDGLAKYAKSLKFM